MPDKRRSRSGQGGLVIESRPKAGSLRLKQKLNGGSAGLVGSAAAAIPSREARLDRSEMGDLHRPPRHTPCRDFYHSLWGAQAQSLISRAAADPQSRHILGLERQDKIESDRLELIS
jgi:hypothetical protein